MILILSVEEANAVNVYHPSKLLNAKGLNGFTCPIIKMAIDFFVNVDLCYKSSLPETPGPNYRESTPMCDVVFEQVSRDLKFMKIKTKNI